MTNKEKGCANKHCYPPCELHSKENTTEPKEELTPEDYKCGGCGTCSACTLYAKTHTEPSFEEWRAEVISDAAEFFEKFPTPVGIRNWIDKKISKAHSLGKKEGAAEERERILAALPEEEPDVSGHYGINDHAHIQHNIGFNAALQIIKTAIEGGE